MTRLSLFSIAILACFPELYLLRFNAIESGLAKLSWSFLVFLVVPSPTSTWRLVPFTSASKERRLNHRVSTSRHGFGIFDISYILTPKYLLSRQTSFGPLSHLARTSRPRSSTPRLSPHQPLAARIPPREIVKECPEREDFILSREE